ncbi:Ferredoxin [Methanosarcina siciliae C2J]|uniref:Ferredoxin n=1 Tax=Methanosarcina siciliae C2J TaxID=1434118 RepID=A0A0E3LD27_9EURY|nr:Ferredoxin [Methanosarcina siciliae C2J]
MMHLAEYERTIQKQNRTVIKINLSWSLFYPACSTPPWQLEGVLKTLQNDGYKDVVGVENQTVVTHPWKGAYLNKWLPVLKELDVEYSPLTNEEWIPFKPKSEMLAMNDIFGEIIVPKLFLGSNVIHLPTVKTHGHTTTTGSIKNAFGGLIPKKRHHAHRKIHEVLVDLLAIQKEIHKGIFATMDGCICGNGAGPRTMTPHIGNLILASEDQVAIDAIAAKTMGFDPLQIDYIKMAHDRGLGIGDVDQIEIIGMDRNELNKTNFGFEVSKSPVIKWDQRLRRGTANIKWLHSLLFHSPVFKTFIFASETYHDRIWYPTVGKKNIEEFMKTEWGKLFEKYEYGDYPVFDEVKEWNPY